VYNSPEPPNEDVVISSCDSPRDLKTKGGIVVGSVGGKPAPKALAGSAGKESMHIDAGGACLVGAPHVRVDTVQHFATAYNGGCQVGSEHRGYMRIGGVSLPRQYPHARMGTATASSTAGRGGRTFQGHT
jgi:hypothetical protein